MTKKIEASKKVKAEIKRLIKEGKIAYPSKQAAKSLDTCLKAVKAGAKADDLDWTITKVTMTASWGPWKKGDNGNDGGFILSWCSRGAGFGQLTFYKKGNRTYCDSETMSKKFIKTVLDKFLASVRLK